MLVAESLSFAALLHQFAAHRGSLVMLWVLGERHFSLTIPHVMCGTPTSILLARIIRECEEIRRQKKPPLLQTC